MLHYSPIADTVEGEPLEIFPFLGSSRLAEAVDRFDNVKAVVHGHAHRGAYRGATPRGVPVYNVAQIRGRGRHRRRLRADRGLTGRPPQGALDRRPSVNKSVIFELPIPFKAFVVASFLRINGRHAPGMAAHCWQQSARSTVPAFCTLL